MAAHDCPVQPGLSHIGAAAEIYVFIEEKFDNILMSVAAGVGETLRYLLSRGSRLQVSHSHGKTI